MADYWISQPRHFCEICKCWFGENKASIDFHESGKRHQENAKRHLRESRQRTATKEKEKSETARALAAMERAALKAYQRDLEVQAGLPLSQDAVIPLQQQRPGPVESQPQPQPQPQKQSTPQQYRNKQQQSRSNPAVPTTIATPTPSTDITATPPPPPSQWQQLSTPEGVYYYNILTGVSQWEPPAEFQPSQTTESTVGSTAATPTAPTTISPTEGSSEAGQEWQQLSTPEGCVYYYNVSTGVSQWEPPADFQPSQQPQTTEGTTGSPEATPTAPTTASPAEGGSEAGRKRTAEEARLEKRELSKRAADSYGAWTTVAISYEDPEKEETADGDPDEDDKGSSEEDKKHKRMQFEEKTLPTVEQELTPGTFKGFNFKKRTGGSQKRPQIRQRTSEL